MYICHQHSALFKNTQPGTRIGSNFRCAQLTSQLTHKSQNEGLISADRSSMSTLLLTIPRSILSRLQRIYHKGSSSLIAKADLWALLPSVRHLARDVWSVTSYSDSPIIPRGKYCCVLGVQSQSSRWYLRTIGCSTRCKCQMSESVVPLVLS